MRARSIRLIRHGPRHRVCDKVRPVKQPLTILLVDIQVPSLTNKHLYRLIQEAYDAWWAEQEKFRKKFAHLTMPLNRGFIWPFQPVGDPITPKVIRALPRRGEIENQMRWRLKRIWYPYPQPIGRKSQRTMHRILREKRILSVMFTRELISTIRLTWFLYGYYVREQHLHDGKKSQYGYSLRFHRDTMKRIANDLLALEKSATHHKVPPQWIAEYRASMLRALLREASICCPAMLVGFKSATQISPDKSAGDTQMAVYNVIRAVFDDKNIDDNLAYHLVAVIWSPTSSIRQGRLEPSPSAVGRNIRDRLKP